MKVVFFSLRTHCFARILKLGSSDGAVGTEFEPDDIFFFLNFFTILFIFGFRLKEVKTRASKMRNNFGLLQVNRKLNIYS